MKYPRLNELRLSNEVIEVFGGYNHNLRISDSEFFDMKNLSSDGFPTISPRPKRGTYATPALPQGLIAKDSLCYIDGGDFIIKDKDNDTRIAMGLTADSAPKRLISMGAYVIILPDKKYINTADTSDHGSIEATVTTATEVTYTLCDIEGADYEGVVTQDTAPSNPSNGAYWIDTSDKPHTLKQYSQLTTMWNPVPTTYVKISATGIGVPFEVNDGVTIKDVEPLPDLNASMVIWARAENYIVVTGILDAVATQATPITVSRKMPDMDFVIESENRLWGCRYGLSSEGKQVNEIYASKLGDFKNWNCFMGISTDSYAASVGTDGAFTGAITHLGYPLFFKENCLHKVYGNFPANYQIQTTPCRGVQRGCDKSLAIVNEVLFYKARTGVCAYDGSLPSEISSALGETSYSDAVAGAVGNKYYVSMKDDSDGWHLFVYDTKRGLWHKEDDTQAVVFCPYKGDLFYIDYADNLIKSVKGAGIIEPTPVKWMATTGVLGTETPNKKYILRLDVRMLLKVGSSVSFYIEYDSSDEWEYLFTMNGTTLKSFSVPIRPHRCDHLRLKMLGVGDAKIYSICKVTEEGSDI